MNYIGIDVGLQGSICILNNNGKLLKSIKMPITSVKDSSYKNWYNINEIINIFNEYIDSKIVLEYQRPMPGQGVSSMFRLGRGFGLLEGIINTIYKNNVYIVDPKSWQNFLAKKYLSSDINNAFKKKTLNYDIIINSIEDIKFKEWFTKYLTLKSMSSSKAKSAYIYYIINTNDNDILKYEDNNLVDAYLLSKYCYLNL